ncbi:hypothetical protein NDU88_001358 [Pleurodeles waltl]|uniref:Uncharacterized protein n=1 Tax=Pleurodeles waltl TaxID=8319 RepID=A0AAV7U694_PLEWA|nr:hypothetical protein NDU88_001358 [Pleurodeles waltl]
MSGKQGAKKPLIIYGEEICTSGSASEQRVRREQLVPQARDENNAAMREEWLKPFLTERARYSARAGEKKCGNLPIREQETKVTEIIQQCE